MLEPNASIPPVGLWGAILTRLDSGLPHLAVPQALDPSPLASPQARRAPLPLLPDVVIFILLLIGPSEVSLVLPWVIDDFNFLAPIPIGVDPSNSLVDGSAIGSFLPVFNISVTAFGTVLQRGQL
jgi:hypothetical protein